MGNTMNYIQIDHLCKSYGSLTILDNICLQIPRGQMAALLGENGAGKSTLLNILCASIPADSGTISIDGLNLKHQKQKIKNQIGMVFQNGLLDHQLTVEENLLIRGALYHIPHRQLIDRISSISQIVDIGNLLQRPYGLLSGGQKRRCDIARALISQPSILLLDEPTAGLDPKIQKELWTAMKEIQDRYLMTILISTHDMNEAALCDTIYILKEGRILEKGTPAMLQEKYARHRIELTVQSNTLYDAYLAIIRGG